MKAQFYRLFSFMLLSGALVFWSFSELADAYERQAVGYQLSVSELFNRLEQQNALVQQLDAAQLALPADLATQLASGKVIALLQQDQLFYYRNSTTPGRLWQLGPVMPESHSQLPAVLILLAFYSVLVLLLVLLIWPLFRDLQQLQQNAVAFSANPQTLNLSTRPGSAIFPLASAFVQAANQTVSLIELHKNLSRTISHEVRTPLSRMRFALELVTQAVSPEVGEVADNAAPYLARLALDLDEIEHLATNYLAFARLEHHRGSQILHQQSFSSFAVKIEQQFALYRTKFEFEISASAGEACFDAPALIIAVQNLLMNALRFARKRVSLQLELQENSWRILVEDDGPGFADLSNDAGTEIFNRRTDPVVSASQSAGFGLGLYIVRQVAQWHHATLTLGQSERLGGARVQIQLPLSPFNQTGGI